MPVHQQERARQETGQPSACDDGDGSSSAGSDVEARIIALEALPTADLRIEWRKLYRVTPPTRLSRDLLMRGVAYKIQEQAHGGLCLSIRRKLRSLAEGSDEEGRARAAPAVTLRPGTKLVREWHEHVHTVSVLEEGFEYRGGRFRSLTQIARGPISALRLFAAPRRRPRCIGRSSPSWHDRQAAECRANYRRPR
jgi:hypothetical protein